MKTKGLTLVLLSTFMFGSYGIWSRLIGDGLDNFFQAWTRGLLITLLMLPLLIKKKAIKRIDRKDRKWLFIYALFTSLTQAPLFYAFNNMDIGSATLLFFVSMTVTMFIFGIIFLNEKMTRVKFISLFCGLIGLIVIFRFSISAAIIFAALMAIVNGIASGGEVASSKKLTGNYSGLYIAWLSWVVIFVTNLPVSLALGETQILPEFNQTWLWQGCYILASMFGYFFVIEGVKYIEASKASLIGLLEVVISIVLAWLVFSEQITISTGIGALFILIAAGLPSSKLAKRKS